MDSQMAQKTFELQNNIEAVNSIDEIYKYSRQQQQEILARKPWMKEYDLQKYFILSNCSMFTFFQSILGLITSNT